MCRLFRALFLRELNTLVNQNKIHYHSCLTSLIHELGAIRWVVHSTRPTMNTQVIENYLARYINRTAISPSRLSYIKEQQQVQITHNDYHHQKPGQPAPKLIKNLTPLEAIRQILQHCTPPHFQKSRHYGLHNSNCLVKANIPQAYIRSGHSIRTVFEILTQLLHPTQLQCQRCGFHDFHKMRLDKPQVFSYLPIYSFVDNKSPPAANTYRTQCTLIVSIGHVTPMDFFMEFSRIPFIFSLR